LTSMAQMTQQSNPGHWVRTVDPSSLKPGWSLARSPVESAPISAAQALVARHTTRLQRFDSADHFMETSAPPAPPLLVFAISTDGNNQLDPWDRLQPTDAAEPDPARLSLTSTPTTPTTTTLEEAGTLCDAAETEDQQIELPEHIVRRCQAFTIRAALQVNKAAELIKPTPLLEHTQALRIQIKHLSQEVASHSWPVLMEGTLRAEIRKADSGWLRGHSRRSAESWILAVDELRNATAEYKRMKAGLVLMSLMRVMDDATGCGCHSVGELVLEAMQRGEVEEEEATRDKLKRPVRYIKEEPAL